MNEWRLITPDSPTEEEVKKGVIVGNWEDGPLTPHWDTYSCCDRSWSSKRTHWAPVVPPPRPDPDREAFERWWRSGPVNNNGASPLEAWTAALDYERNKKK